MGFPYWIYVSDEFTQFDGDYKVRKFDRSVSKLANFNDIKAFHHQKIKPCTETNFELCNFKLCQFPSEYATKNSEYHILGCRLILKFDLKCQNSKLVKSQT